MYGNRDSPKIPLRIRKHKRIRRQLGRTLLLTGVIVAFLYLVNGNEIIGRTIAVCELSGAYALISGNVAISK